MQTSLFSLISFQQQHFSKLQLRQSLVDLLSLHTCGVQLHSEQFILIWSLKLQAQLSRFSKI